MRTWQELNKEKNKGVSEQDINRIKSLSATIKVWRDSKNYVLDEMEEVKDLNRSLRSPGENSHGIMTQWLTLELQQTIAEIEVENVLSSKGIDPSIRTDKKIRNDWEKID